MNFFHVHTDSTQQTDFCLQAPGLQGLKLPVLIPNSAVSRGTAQKF